MISLVERQRDAIAEICIRHGVQRLDVFGSAVKHTFDDATSDLDFLVDLGDYEPRVASRYFGLIDDLEHLFGRPVDLITVRAIRSPSFRMELDDTRETVFVAGNSRTSRREPASRHSAAEVGPGGS